MIELTPEALQEVREAYMAQDNRVREVRKDFKNQQDRLGVHYTQLTCKHENLEDSGNCVYSSVTCKDCGFCWIGG